MEETGGWVTQLVDASLVQVHRGGALLPELPERDGEDRPNLLGICTSDLGLLNEILTCAESGWTSAGDYCYTYIAN